MDGASDSPKTKSSLKKGRLKPIMRSPSKSAKKYAPLNIVISKSPMVDEQSIVRRNGVSLKV